MSRTPAAELARLKVTHGSAYRIWKEPSGKLVAEERDTWFRFVAATTGELEVLLARDQDHRWGGPS